MDAVYEHEHASLLDLLDDSGRARLRSAGGPGGGDFLAPPSDPAGKRLDDRLFRTALRARLRCCYPGHDAAVSNSTPPTANCQHRDTSRKHCEGDLDESGLHASCCRVGGLVDRWHDACRDWLRGFLATVGTDSLPEQVVPAWHNEHAEAGRREAVLDLMLQDLRGRRTYVDVSFTLADSSNARLLSARARVDGSAAAERVARKRRRYPGDRFPGAALVPFVLEAHGRQSPETHAFLKAMVPPDWPERDAVLARARRDLSVLTQCRLADLLLSAERLAAA
jgi:hypothetical protein